MAASKIQKEEEEQGGGSGRTSPCPPSSSKDKTADVPMPDAVVCEEPIRRVLEPLPTFAADWRSQAAFAPSFAPQSPPSPFLRSPPTCSSVFFGGSSGPVDEVRGFPGEGGMPRRGEEETTPIRLPPIRLPAAPAADKMREDVADYAFNRSVPPKKRGKKIGVASVPMKTPARASLPGGLVLGVLKTTTTTTTTMTTTTLSPPASPPASSSRCPRSPVFAPVVVPFVDNNSSQVSATAANDAADNNNRKRVTPAQLDVLEKAFECGMIPDLETRRRLAQRLGFTERRVQIWFQNRRAKMKKDNQKSSVFIINSGIESYKN